MVSFSFVFFSTPLSADDLKIGMPRWLEVLELIYQRHHKLHTIFHINQLHWVGTFKEYEFGMVQKVLSPNVDNIPTNNSLVIYGPFVRLNIFVKTVLMVSHPSGSYLSSLTVPFRYSFGVETRTHNKTNI